MLGLQNKMCEERDLAVTFESLLVMNGLPPDFGPNHPNWNTPSKKARYNSSILLYSATTTSTPQGMLVPPEQTMGVAISTYFREKNRRRLDIFLASIYSMLASGFPGTIIVVDDGSASKDHLKEIKGIDRISVIERKDNGGVSKCKNTCLKAMMPYEHIFLVDDDLVYNGNWWGQYVVSSLTSGVRHYSYFDLAFNMITGSENKPCKTTNYNGAPILSTPSLNGVLLYLRRNLIDLLGGFKVMPCKYGSEHINYTMRAVKAGMCPFFCDVPTSNSSVRINTASWDFKSVEVDIPEMVTQYQLATTNVVVKELIVE